MTGSGKFDLARRVTIFCPIEANTLTALVSGDLNALARDAYAGRILAKIEHSNELGNFGPYRGVCELAIGVEAFTPLFGAQPTVGQTGQRTLSPTITITTYVATSLSPTRLNELLDAIAAVHPWEVPVIDVADVRLFGRTMR